MLPLLSILKPSSGGGAPSGTRAIVFNGTSQSAKVVLPNSAPFSSLGAFKFVFKARAVSQDGVMFRVSEVDVAEKFSITVGDIRIDFFDNRDNIQIFHEPSSLSDVIGKLQYDPANTRWTYETWQTNGTGRVVHTEALTTTSNLNFGGATLTIASNEYDLARGAFKLDWLYMQSGVDALDVFPGATVTTGSTYLKYTFDSDNGNDTSGNGLNLTLVGTPTFEDTP